jgi:hypothetical protein
MKSAAQRALAVILLRVAVLVVLAWHAAFGRDLDGKYAQSDNHEWVHGLHSPSGTWCCDLSDGHTITDADWQTKGGRYQVRIDGQWIDVPEDAVITEPNRIGQTVVWYVRHDGVPAVTCFLPGGGA